MYNEIEVRDILVDHDCGGRMQLYVTSLHDDETVASKFLLTPVYMLPHEKLSLACVQPHDRVTVYTPSLYLPNSPHLEDYLVAGEYLKNNNKTSLYEYRPECFCGADLYSDGHVIECRNLDCTLTLKARIKRLSQTAFFEPPFMFYDEDGKYWFDDNGMSGCDKTKPFSVIMTSQFWGNQVFDLENTLQQYQYHYGFNHNQLDLSDFLIPNKFTDLLCKIHHLHVIAQQDQSRASACLHSLKQNYQWIWNVYGRLEEVASRRDVNADWQNKLLGAFLNGLGLKSLDFETIQTFVDLDIQYYHMAALSDPFLNFAFFLNNTEELISTCGFHPVKAHAITQESKKRRFELGNILGHYSLNRDDVESLFSEPYLRR